MYSDEVPRKPLNLDGGREKFKNVGSISFVPPVAGMLLASAVIKRYMWTIMEEILWKTIGIFLCNSYKKQL